MNSMSQLTKFLKERGILLPPIDSPVPGDRFAVRGEEFEVLALDWPNEVILVRDSTGHEWACGYFTYRL